jgi:hypothetical protein
MCELRCKVIVGVISHLHALSPELEELMAWAGCANVTARLLDFVGGVHPEFIKMVKHTHHWQSYLLEENAWLAVQHQFFEQRRAR